MEIKDLEKPANLSVKVKTGKLLQVFLLECLKQNININDLFNHWIEKFLGITITKKSNIDIYAEYFADNSDKIITRTDLRSLNLVNANKFKKYFEENFLEIKSKVLNEYGYAIYDFKTKKNIKAYQLVKVVK